MRHILPALAIGACILIANSPAPASERDAPTGIDMSAAKKKKQQRYIERQAAPAVAARRGWFDPSLGPDGKPYRNPYPPGTCSTDLGYGRFGNCEFHD
jgi:hypothetical protein